MGDIQSRELRSFRGREVLAELNYPVTETQIPPAE
jgi:hypothetical protein